MLLFLANHIVTIIFIAWTALAVFGIAKYLGWKPSSRVSWKVLTCIAIGTHVAIGFILSTLQYLVWKTSAMGTVFAQAALPEETPLPAVLESARFLFEYQHGYFVFYSLTRFFSGAVALFFVIGLFILLLTLIKNKIPNSFKEHDIWIVAFSCSVVGWPHVIVFIPTAFVLLTLWAIVLVLLKKKNDVYLSGGFILLTIPFLLVGNVLLSVFHLYTLLAL